MIALALDAAGGSDTAQVNVRKIDAIQSREQYFSGRVCGT